MRTLIKIKFNPIFMLHSTCNNSNQVISKIEILYAITQFKNQLWTSSNYLQTVFNYRDKIKEAKNVKEWDLASQKHEPKDCYLNVDSTKRNLYGVYYKWFALNNPKGLAPKGWRIPSMENWNNLFKHFSISEDMVKENNATGSNAKVFGYCKNSAGFASDNIGTAWWASQEFNLRA